MRSPTSSTTRRTTSRAGFNIAEEAPEIALLSAVYSTSAANAMNYVNTDVDAQIQIVRSGKTDAERKAALEKIQDIWRQDMPTPVYEALSGDDRVEQERPRDQADGRVVGDVRQGLDRLIRHFWVRSRCRS